MKTKNPNAKTTIRKVAVAALRRAAGPALALTALLVAPAFAADDAAQCGQVSDRVAHAADAVSIAELADHISEQLPSRTRVAQVEDPSNRLFLTRVLDHIEIAKRADELTGVELERFAEDVRTTAASAQIGVQACAAQSAEIGEVSQAPRTAAAADRDCSCVEQCKNEWLDNMADCDGSYWCEVGATLLFELCLADCLVPG